MSTLPCLQAKLLVVESQIRRLILGLPCAVDQPISSVEQALAILAAGKHSKKSKKDKKHKKEKKEKHAKHKHKHKS